LRFPVPLFGASNRSHLRDGWTQRRVGQRRGRAEANSWIGQRIDDPTLDIIKIAQGYGAETIGPVATCGDLGRAIERGLDLVRTGSVCVIDARVVPGSPSRLAEYKPEKAAG